MPRLLKILLLSSALPASALVLYWAKCQLGIELIRGFQWEEKLPVLERLQRRPRILESARGAAVVDAANERFFPLRHWMKLWTEDEFAGDARVQPGEGVNGGACLRIDHRSQKTWALHRFDLVRTEPGQVFSIKAKIRTSGAEVRLAIEALALANGPGRTQPLGTVKFQESPEWSDVSQTFNVPEGAGFLRLSIRGNGPGSVWIDGLKLIREN